MLHTKGTLHENFDLFDQFFYTKGMSKLAEDTVASCAFCTLNNKCGFRPQIGCDRLVVTRPRQLVYSDIASFLSGTKTKQKSFIFYESTN